jgi:hypothetical protein
MAHGFSKVRKMYLRVKPQREKKRAVQSARNKRGMSLRGRSCSSPEAIPLQQEIASQKPLATTSVS